MLQVHSPVVDPPVARQARALARGRLLLASAISPGTARQPVHVGESLADWSTRLLHELQLPAGFWLDLHDGIVARDLFDELELPDDLDDALSRNAELATDRADSGAVYTAPDVTRYINANTIIPALLDRWGVDVATVDEAVTSVADMPALARRHLRQFDDLTIIDPTCGSGAFLLDAARLLDEVFGIDPEAAPQWAHALRGIDIDPVAVEACRARLLLHAARTRGADQLPTIARLLCTTITCADALDPRTWQQVGDVDAVIGNPPYVRTRADELTAETAALDTASCGNAFALVVDRALAALAPGARFGMIVPVSALCADAFEPLRSRLHDSCAAVWASSYDTVPCTLFPGTVQRLTIFLARAHSREHAAPSRWMVTRYHKWRARQRPQLFGQLRYTAASAHTLNGSVAKIGTQLERDLLDRLFTHQPLGELLAPRGSVTAPNRFFYKRRWSYFLLLLDFMPDLFDADGVRRDPTEFKAIDVTPDLDARVVLATLNSSLFYWYFTVFSDNRNVNLREIAAFPFNRPTASIAAELALLSDELMASLRRNSELRTCTYRSIGTIRNTYFRQAQTRPELDRIDEVLARHYGLSDRELDFVLSHEHEYRTAVSAASR